VRYLLISRNSRSYSEKSLGIGFILRLDAKKLKALEYNINILLISLIDDTQPYRAEVRDRSIYS